MDELKKLAEENGIKLTKRLFVDDKETGKTVFLDVEKSRQQLVDELRAVGAIT
jgi:hypothetical protein